ncbi:MAG: hypothetical protein U1E28_06350 [Beijerinckiaceae bacterium]
MSLKADHLGTGPSSSAPLVMGAPEGEVTGKTMHRSEAARADDAVDETPRFALTDICKAMEIDNSIGPVAFFNSYLVPLRISGTMAAARPSLNEIAFRDPEIWRDLVPACLGLPVIVDHPASGQLNSAEFAARAVGSIVHAWVHTDPEDNETEIWGVARILDANAAQLISEGVLFDTSPAVIFHEGSEGEYVDVEGQRCLVEGVPALIDHIALLAGDGTGGASGQNAGVWSRDAEPGIRTGEEGVSTN